MADAYDGPDARAAKRVSCCLGAIVYSRGKPYSSEVKDISILGCRLRLPSLEAASSLSDMVLIDVIDCNLTIYGRPVWRRLREIGIKFDLSRRVTASKEEVRRKRGNL